MALFLLKSRPILQFALAVAIGLLGSACAPTPNPTIELPSNNDFDRVNEILVEKFGDDTAGAISDSIDQAGRAEPGSSPPSTSVTPLGISYTDEDEERLLQLIAEGVFYAQPESSKLRAVAGAWEDAFGSPPTSEDLIFAQSVAENYTILIDAEMSCADIDAIMDSLASRIGSDRGRTEYVFGSAVMMWMPPQQAISFFKCFP